MPAVAFLASNPRFHAQARRRAAPPPSAARMALGVAIAAEAAAVVGGELESTIDDLIAAPTPGAVAGHLFVALMAARDRPAQARAIRGGMAVALTLGADALAADLSWRRFAVALETNHLEPTP